jgi:hypothetical protein
MCNQDRDTFIALKHELLETHKGCSLCLTMRILVASECISILCISHQVSTKVQCSHIVTYIYWSSPDGENLTFKLIIQVF